MERTSTLLASGQQYAPGSFCFSNCLQNTGTYVVTCTNIAAPPPPPLPRGQMYWVLTNLRWVW